MKNPKHPYIPPAPGELFVAGRQIVRYDGKLCHLSCRKYYFKIRHLEGGAFQLLYRGSGDREEYRRLKEKIEVLEEAPAALLTDIAFWEDYFRALGERVR